MLDPQEQTVATLLQDLGYTTGIAGKWQLYGNEYQRILAESEGSTPTQSGFDEFALWQLHELGSRYQSPTIHYSGNEPEVFPELYGPDLFADYIGEFFQRHRDDPFFLYQLLITPILIVLK